MYEWYPLLDDSGNLKSVAGTRPRKFDSNLTECGSPAIITDKGILLIYYGTADSFVGLTITEKLKSEKRNRKQKQENPKRKHDRNSIIPEI